MTFAQDAAEFFGMVPGITVVVDSVWNADPIQPRLEVEKDAHLAARPCWAAQQPADEPSWKTIQRKPAVEIWLGIKQIQRMSIETHGGALGAGSVCGGYGSQAEEATVEGAENFFESDAEESRRQDKYAGKRGG